MPVKGHSPVLTDRRSRSCVRKSTRRISALTGRSLMPNGGERFVTELPILATEEISGATLIRTLGPWRLSREIKVGRQVFRTVREKLWLKESGMEHSPRSVTGSLISRHRPMIALSATGSDQARSSIGPLQNWIEEFYPGVFAPEWLYGGKKRGWSLRYKKTKAFCTFVPEYRRFSAVVVLGEQNERSLRSVVMSGARNWSSFTMTPKHTRTGNS